MTILCWLAHLWGRKAKKDIKVEGNGLVSCKTALDNDTRKACLVLATFLATPSLDLMLFHAQSLMIFMSECLDIVGSTLCSASCLNLLLDSLEFYRILLHTSTRRLCNMAAWA